MTTLKVAALTRGEPGPHELWTFRRLASAGRVLRVVQDAPALEAPPLELARTLAGRHGPLSALLTLAGRALGSRIAAWDEALLDEMFDLEDLRAWWKKSGIAPFEVRAGDLSAAHAALAAFSPDVIVRLSGDLPGERTLSLARILALDVRHGHGPLRRGVWSSARGIIDGRPDWIGAEIVALGGAFGRGRVIRRLRPQLAPGDTHVDLFFRAHLEATEALSVLLASCARGELPKPCALAGELPARVPSAGLRDLLELLKAARGRRARVLLARGLEC